MGDAASEMHLLREAEAYLGALIWEAVEGIEELSVEYWNLRKYIKEHQAIRERMTECQSRLDRAHEERSNVINNAPEFNQELLDERVTLLRELEQLAHERDEIIANAREIRRTYDGLKMKLEVLTTESNEGSSNNVEIQKVKSRLHELKNKFAELKTTRIDIGVKIQKGDEKIDNVDVQLNEKKKDRRVNASEAFQLIGDGNKEMSILRAEDALINTQMRQLYAEIGRYVSRNSLTNTACASAAKSHKVVVDVMRALRRSIAFNHRLADRS